MLPLLLSSAFAVEGMWLPAQMPELAEQLAEVGVTLSPNDLSDYTQAPLSSIVSLGFCSGSFVSPDGLVITNHHCAEGFLALNSNDGTDYRNDGFVADSRADELPAGPGARLYVIESSADVTDTVVVALAGKQGADRTAALEKIQTKLVGACERAPGHRCRLVADDGGVAWRLTQALELRDVRIVAAPPANVGFFGGDLDNFEWPRHDGDYAFLRAYVGKNGLPADPSPSNVPYHPRSFLPIDPTGAQPGEAVLSIGFPGHTERFAPFNELEHAYKVTNPKDLSDLRWLEAMLTEVMATSDAARTHLQAALFNLENGRKYLEGIQDNVAASPLLEHKQAVDEAARDGGGFRFPELGRAIGILDGIQAELRATEARDEVLGWLGYSDRLSTAHEAWRWAVERTKKDADREPGLQDRDRAGLVADFTELDQTFWEPAEHAVVVEALRRAAALPADQRIGPVDALLARHQGSPEAAWRDELASAALDTASARVALLSRSAAQLEASTDPWVRLAVAMDRQVWAPKRERDDRLEGAHLDAWPAWVANVRAHINGPRYPDANGTMRISFGRVEGYKKVDGLLALPQTTLSGLVAKDRLEAYEAPAWLIEAAGHPRRSPYFDAALDDVPVNFLSSLDTTGGNSGSATINGRGELVGLVFDGNYESMAADWMFDPATTRSVHIDIRYILWVLSQQADAAWVLKELAVKPTP